MEFTAEIFRKRIVASLGGAQEENRAETQTAADLEQVLRIQQDRDFLEAAYQQILGRPIDPGGLASYLEALANNTSRRLVLKRITESDEAQQKAIRQFSGMARQEVTSGRSPFAYLQRLRWRLTAMAYHLLRKVLFARFDSLDYKLTFLMQELAERNDALSTRVDQ